MNRLNFRKTIAAATILVAVTTVLAETENPPNIILIMADDMGYGDLGCYGNKVIATPNIDTLADEGMRCTDFYAAAAWCMPSRKGLMTGIHPHRGGLSNSKALAERVTIAEMLKSHGYATALLGKWHLGGGEGNSPMDQGFDYHYGTPGSNDAPAPKGRKQTYDTFKTAKEEEWPIPLMRNGEVIEKPAKQSLFTQRYTNEAVRFIKKNKENPFFIYLAHNMPHVPLFASEKFKGKSKGGIFGDVIEELDWSVGEIVKTLKEQGLSDSTLVVFTSDNGPWTMFKEFGGTAGPLRGEKSTTWEGGPRVPCIFYWPGRIKPSVSSAFMVNIDIYKTIASVTGSKIQPGEAVDGLDMSEVLFDNQKSPRKDYLFIHEIPLSYRSGDYKIHFGTRERTRNPDTGKGEPAVILDKPLLFNIKKDIGEKNDMASENPEILQRLIKEFHAAVKDITGKDYPK
jgi:arylsulfatase A